MDALNCSLNSSINGIPIEKKQSSYNITIGGVEVNFPYRAYPSQISMMDKIIRSLSKKQNCLLESPTGSGKSLALLCSALAWQRKQKEEKSKLMNELQSLVEVPVYVDIPNAETNTPNAEANKPKAEFPVYIDSPDAETKTPKTEMQTPKAEMKLTGCTFESKKECSPFCGNEKNDLCCKSADTKRYRSPDTEELYADDDFKPSKIFRKQDLGKKLGDQVFFPLGKKVNPIFSTPIKSHSPQKRRVFDTPIPEIEKDFKNIPECNHEIEEKPPKIYFGTRTHKQISQIIRELKKTTYKNTKMTILSSRDHTCVLPSLQNQSGREKQEGCDDLLSAVGGPACPYYRSYRQISHKNPKMLSLAWDIEDLVTKLKQMRACPYYSARALIESSDIVFCPYNYLIDPMIRSSLSINLSDSIIIMDEAHNIEDASRESASFTMQQSKIIEAMGDLMRKISTRSKKSQYGCFIDILKKIGNWMEEWEKLLTSKNSFDAETKVFAGAELIVLLSSFGCDKESFKVLKESFAALQAEESEIGVDDTTADVVKLASSTMVLLKGFMLILNCIYSKEMKYMPDYRCVVLRKRKIENNPIFWRRGNATMEFSINFWCLNPAVSLSDIKDETHSIIVTSGTLTPMLSFQSELDVPFQIKLAANHVITSSQIWVGTIGQGPNGNTLKATYGNSETFVFQDEMGNLLLKVCSIIPHGVLCFMPSYNMLEKLVQRWQTTGLWNQLSSIKAIMCEPRGQRLNFEHSMTEFYNAVKESEISVESGLTGALFFAVCRGKVSEGLDFSDNNARAVVTIGIPFPNLKDAQVELKRKYNDSLCSTNGIMSGNEWYETQAFRALNQALGRCIRHRNDYGALIIVDERFQREMRYVDSLSKWIGKEVVHFKTFNHAMSSLKEFSKSCGLIDSTA